MRWCKTTRTAVAIGGSMLLASCGSDKGPGPAGPGNTTVPAAWAGIWQFEITVRECPPSGAIIDSFSDVDTLCAGEDARQAFAFEECAGSTVTITETTVSVTCSNTITEGGCSALVSVSMNGTVNAGAGTITATGRITYDIEPNNAECGDDQCVDLQISGTRIAAAPASCGSGKPGLADRVLGRTRR